MRHEASVTTISWIPSEAVTGMTKGAFAAGFTHYDEPPPDRIEGRAGLEVLNEHDGFRFANRLEAWVEVQDGRVVTAGYGAGGMIGSTTVHLGNQGVTFTAVELPQLRADPVVTDGGARFEQTYGGRTGLPAPRRVPRPPFVQWRAPLVWTTLVLEIRADGTSAFELTGASQFPRHWVYGTDGALCAKVGLADFKQWYRHSFGRQTPWGATNSTALVTAVESALERELSTHIMRGEAKPDVRSIKAGKELARQGEAGDEVFLVLDGVVAVEHNEAPLAEFGPGAILGERAVLEGGARTATLRAVTKCRVAAVRGDHLDRGALEELSRSHRRESDAAQ